MAIKTQVESPTPIWKASDSWAARNPSTGARDWEILKICWPASLEKRWASGQWSSNWPPMYTYTDICATHSGHTQTQINFKKYLKLQRLYFEKEIPKSVTRGQEASGRTVQRMLSGTSLWNMSTSLIITIRANDMASLSWCPLNCWQLAYQSYSLRTLVPYSPKDPHGARLSLLLPLGLKWRCDSVRSYHLLFALQSLLWATPDAYRRAQPQEHPRWKFCVFIDV